MKYRLVLLFLFISLSWLSVNTQTLVLHHTDGQTTDIELSEKPRIRFGTDNILISSSTLNLEYARKDVERFTFKAEDTGVGSVKNKIAYRIENDRIVFLGVTKADRIKVCSISGATLPVHLSMDGSNAILQLSTLPSDVCILTLNGKSFKLIKPKQ